MKRVAIVLVVASSLLGAVPPPSPPVTHVDANVVAEALSHGGPLGTTEDYKVSGNFRNKPGEVEVHDHETDIFYMTAGEATIITGGTVVGARVTEPGQTRGSDIKGGQSHHVVKGDVMTIPAGTPHWFKEVSSPVSYFVVKVIK